MPKLRNVFNIPLSCSFWDTLAKSFLEKYSQNDLALADVLFLVPNRRACQSFTAAFVREQGLKPTILPKIIPIAEIDDEELFFDTFGVVDDIEQAKSVITNEERLFLFSRMIMSKPADFGLKQISLAQAVNLAKELASLIDTACNQGLSFDKLYDLVPDKYAAHWQETLKLLKIITEYWPHILEERHAVDMCDFKKTLLYKQADIWQQEKTERHIIAAGITASFPAIVNLLKVILTLPNGEIYFAGLDTKADETYWDAIDESHPQFELKELLEHLLINRDQIENFCLPQNEAREKFISEIMRPASVSNNWQKLRDNTSILDSLKNISLLESKTQRDEALAIALKMREILNFDGKTAALITYDRNLARRVASELGRFEVKIDDSAGLPLSLSPIGIFLRLIIEAAQNTDSDINFIGLMKNPFMLFHTSAADFRKKVYDYEYSLRKKNTVPDENISSFFRLIKEKLIDFAELLALPQVSFEDIIKKHLEIAEEFAASDEKSGKKILWRGDAGKCAAKFITKMLESAKFLGMIDGKDYLQLFLELMSFESVRSSYGTHPRLSILGPIEARLCHFDYVILGEINEGIWPKPEQADMWMSRPMKKDFGFSLPEKNIGILGADLCGFLSADNVILTRAERVDGTPMKKSRWLLRMETVLGAMGSNIKAFKSTKLSQLAAKLDTPETSLSITAPAPCPPLYARPTKLSASAVDLLVADPYSVFAKYILKLYPLDDLDIPLDQRDYGTLIHGIIETFNNSYPQQLPENALNILINTGKKCFDEAHIEQELRAFWWPKFVKTAIAYIALENRLDTSTIYNEIEGNLSYKISDTDIVFTAKADRIDILNGGGVNIIDYKTGKIPTKKQVMSGHALQLLLEGLIAQKGNFNNLSAKEVNQLVYWHLGDKTSPKNVLVINPKEDDVMQKCEDYLLKLISTFNFESTPYYSRPIPKYIPKNRDYEHLARVKEWSVQDDEEGRDE